MRQEASAAGEGAAPRQAGEAGRRVGMNDQPTGTLKPGHATSTQGGFFKNQLLSNQRYQVTHLLKTLPVLLPSSVLILSPSESLEAPYLLHPGPMS